MRSLAGRGVSFTKAHAEDHPSQPNYLVMFSGSNQGVTSDATPPQKFGAPSLGGQILTAGRTFVGYSEDLPSVGFTGSKSRNYARKHAPWVDFKDVPDSANRPFSDFPRDFTKLPDLSFVIPNQQHDMHSGTIASADNWLEHSLGGYANWAVTHNSLLIVTWDEGRGDNHIPTIFFGAKLRDRKTSQSFNHYRLLRTIEGLFRLPPIGGAADISPLRTVFTKRKAAAASAKPQALSMAVASFSQQLIADVGSTSEWRKLEAADATL
jgi:acid phosphatase